MNLSDITPQMAKQYAPDPDRASDALRSAFNAGLEVKLTRHKSIEGKVSIEQFQQVFRAQLVEEEPPAPERGAYFRKGPVLTTREEIRVPDDMQDTIAFAYIPTPPIFFQESLIPPAVSVYHLRLNDVHRALGGSLCHRFGWTGQHVRVAMTDTGFANHPYFVSQGYTIERVSTPSTENPLIDTNGHGTGESANVLIMAPDCHFIGVKHNDYSAEALETALDQDPHIITNSWGWDIDNQTKAELQANAPNLFNELRDLENIVNDAIDDGVVIIFSAGNGHLAFPASMPEVLAVGGVTVENDGNLMASSYASSFKSQLFFNRQVPDFCGIVGEWAPNSPLKGHIMLPVPSGSDLEGDNMPQNKQNRGWGIFSGTSAAAPQIAGIVAQMLSVNPDLTPRQVKSILADTATDVTQGTSGLGDVAGPGYDQATGAGFANAFDACLRAESLLPE
jgi:subtilisin family serine protease